jgi:hypothetical protein
MPRTVASAQAISDRCAVNDNHGHVRLQALVAFAEIGAKPANPTPMWTPFRNVDDFAKNAFTASGLAAADARPCQPALDPVGLPTGAAPAAQPRHDLRFTARAGGFSLVPNGRLPAGSLTVFDLRGHVAFRSAYDAAAGSWSAPEASGLREPVYGWEFRGVDGALLRGSVAPLAGL